MGSNWLKGVLGKVIVDEKGIKDSWKSWWMKKMNGIIEYCPELKKNQQIALGLMKLLQHWKRWKDKKPQAVRASNKNDTRQRGYWNSVDIKCVGKPAGNSVSWGDGRKCRGWYTFKKLEGENFRFYGSTNKVKALRETQPIDFNQGESCTGLIPSSITG